jgi:23S rRNA (cytosine1962-C5)-methyltransferase
MTSSDTAAPASTPVTHATLSARGVDRYKTGHPWIYRSDVISTPDEPGLYQVKDARGKILGWAAVNAKSEITVRFLTRFDEPANTALLVRRLERAIAYRETLNIEADSYRIVHGDADGLPSLVIDKYADILVVQNASAALEPHLDALLEVLIERYQPKGVLARFDHRNRAFEGLEQEVFVAHGKVNKRITATEGEIKFFVDPYEGQKTGAFLDQRENRLALAKHARGHGLDVFSYHGSFALHLAQKCATVDCIDSSAPALERAAENATLNGLSNLEFTVGNAFEIMRERERANQKYSVIAVDPPALAKARRDLERAYAAYKEVNLRALRLLEPGGILGTASCSYHLLEPDFYAMLRDAAADAGVRVRVLERRGASADHPDVLHVPESRYLKYAILEVLE